MTLDGIIAESQVGGKVGSRSEFMTDPLAGIDIPMSDLIVLSAIQLN